MKGFIEYAATEPKPFAVGSLVVPNCAPLQGVNSHGVCHTIRRSRQFTVAKIWWHSQWLITLEKTRGVFLARHFVRAPGKNRRARSLAGR